MHIGPRRLGRQNAEVFQDGSSCAHRPTEDLDVPHATFDAPDLTAFCRLEELGLEAVGQRLEPGRAVIECRIAEPDPDPGCRKCGAEGGPRPRHAAARGSTVYVANQRSDRPITPLRDIAAQDAPVT